MQLSCRLALEEENVQLLIARRLHCLVATCPQPAVPGGAVHRTEHRGRAQQGGQLLDVGGVVEVANVKRGVVRHHAYTCRKCRSNQRQDQGFSCPSVSAFCGRTFMMVQSTT